FTSGVPSIGSETEPSSRFKIRSSAESLCVTSKRFVSNSSIPQDTSRPSATTSTFNSVSVSTLGALVCSGNAGSNSVTFGSVSALSSVEVSDSSVDSSDAVSESSADSSVAVSDSSVAASSEVLSSLPHAANANTKISIVKNNNLDDETFGIVSLSFSIV